MQFMVVHAEKPVAGHGSCGLWLKDDRRGSLTKAVRDVGGR